MKKMMVLAAAAALTAGAFASACSDPEEVSVCRAWDVSLNLKTLCPKLTTCTVEAESACEDSTKEKVYFLDNTTRKIKGYLWICEYECGKDFNVCLWDSKHSEAIIPVAYEAVSFEDVYVYGKKATKVCGTLEFASDAIEVTASGMNGKMVRGSEDSDCYVSSLSGYAAGKLAYIKPESSTVSGSSGTLCEDPEEVVVCEEYVAKILPLCDACCFDGWCDADDADDLLPTVGTWKMKYNKKVSKGTKTIAQLVPSYAL